MQNNFEGIYADNGRYCDWDGAQKYHKVNRNGHQDMDVSFEFDDSDQLKHQKLNSPLQTVNVEVRDPIPNHRLDFDGDQNKDLANCSTNSSSLDHDFILQKEEITGSFCWGANSFSAKFAAPVKKSKRGNYKNLLRNFDRKEFSGNAFLSKLNQWDTKEVTTSVFDNVDIEMSLESHLEKLSRQYKAKSKKVSQAGRETSDDLYLKIHNKSYCDKGLKLTLQSKKRYYQRMKKSTTNISFLFFASVKYHQLEKYLRVFKEQKGTYSTADNFFKVLGKEFWEDGIVHSIKVDDEPLFPVKMTLEYLWNRYKNIKARLIIT